MKLFGFRVSIHSTGEELKEYSVELSPDGKKATCWVSSQSGKAFKVRYKDGRSSVIKHRAKSMHVYVDGHRMRKVVLLPHETSGSVSGVRTSDNTERPFVFADIQTTDEDAVPNEIHVNLEEMGTICVQTFLVKSWRRDNSSGKYKVQDHPPAVINERKKKAVEHCVSLGDEQPRATSGRYSTVYDSNEPDMVFEFRYRSMAMLQAQGIVPPSKREVPPVIDVEDDDTLPPRKRQKAGQKGDTVRSMQAELDRLRRRVGELEEGKAGPSGIKKEVVKHDPADIIDLT